MKRYGQIRKCILFFLDVIEIPYRVDSDSLASHARKAPFRPGGPVEPAVRTKNAFFRGRMWVK